MKIGIIAAMQVELNAIKASIVNLKEEKKQGIDFYVGSIGKNEIILSLCGIGKVNAAISTAVMINSYNPELVINTGIAGGLAPLTTKDVVIAEALSYHDVDVRIFGYDYGQIPQMVKYFKPKNEIIELAKKTLDGLNISYKLGNIYSGDKFVSSYNTISDATCLPGSAIEMEGCAIAHTAYKAGVDFLVLRYISDIIGADNQVDDYLAFEQEMAERSAKITLMLVNKI